MLSHFLLRLRLFNALPNAAIQRANPPFLFNFTRVTCLDQKCLSFTCLFMCFRLFCRVSSELRPRSTGPRFRTHSSHICSWRLLAVLKSQIHRTRLSCWRSTSSFGFAGHIKVFMRALTAQFKVQSHLTVLQVLFHKVDKSTDWSLSALTNYLYRCNTERKEEPSHHQGVSKTRSLLMLLEQKVSVFAFEIWLLWTCCAYKNPDPIFPLRKIMWAKPQNTFLMLFFLLHKCHHEFLCMKILFC